MMTSKTIRAHLSAGSAALALLAAGPAFAQTAPPAKPQAAAAPETGLEEIVVTAQRRAENLQDVPIAVSAVTANQLKNTGIDATKDLPQIVPSVQMSRSGPSGLLFIRGVGTTNAAAGEEGANALYIDGVYIGDLGQVINTFNNIDRIEVLKGPQGTLFGRNATGGLIQIITREPGRDFKVDGQVGYANYNTENAQLYVGGPVAENLSADIALTQLHQADGWGRNLTTGKEIKKNDYKGARSKIVARPTDTLKLTLAGDFFHSKDDLGLAWRIADGVIGTGGQRGPTGNNGHDTTSNMPALTKLRIWGVSFTGEWDMDFATLTNISALRRSRNHSAFDVDGGPTDLVDIDYISTGKTFQEELRLASKDTEPFSWQIGGFYLHSVAATGQRQFGLAFAPAGVRQLFIDSSLTTDSYAAFGEATYSITPTTKITGGVRYTKDKRDFDGKSTTTLLSGVALAPTAVLSTLKYNKFTYRAAIRQEITPDISVYASVNRGFKAGAYSLQSPTNPPVKPQFIMAYEGGIKSELFDRKLRLNLAGYHYDISNYQVRSAASANPGANIFLNAATVKVDGFDVDFEARPTNRLRMFGGLTVLNSRYSKFGGAGAAFQAPIVYPNPATCPTALIGTENPGVLGAGARTGGYTTCFGDVSGNRTPLAPRFTGSFGSSYTFAIGQRGELRLSALYSYNSGYYFEPDNVAHQGHYNLLNGSIEYRPVPAIGVELFVRNLTQEQYAVQDLTTGTGITQANGAPRTFGANLKFSF